MNAQIRAIEGRLVAETEIVTLIKSSLLAAPKLVKKATSSVVNMTTSDFTRLFLSNWSLTHDDVIKWEHFPRYWPFVRGIHRCPVNSPHKGQYRRALMFFDMRLNKLLGKQSRRRWFETPSRSLWRHCKKQRNDQSSVLLPKGMRAPVKQETSLPTGSVTPEISLSHAHRYIVPV